MLQILVLSVIVSVGDNKILQCYVLGTALPSSLIWKGTYD